MNATSLSFSTIFGRRRQGEEALDTPLPHLGEKAGCGAFGTPLPSMGERAG